MKRIFNFGIAGGEGRVQESARERERPRECDLDLTAFMPVLRLCSEARLQVLRSWCRQQAKHIPFDGQKGSGALRILPG